MPDDSGLRVEVGVAMKAVGIADRQESSLDERGNDNRTILGGDDFGRDDSLFGPGLVTHWACYVLVELLFLLGLCAQNIWLALEKRSGKILVHGLEHG